MSRRARCLGSSFLLLLMLSLGHAARAQDAAPVGPAAPAPAPAAAAPQATPPAAEQSTSTTTAPARRRVARRVHRAPRARPAEPQDQAYEPPLATTVPAPAPRTGFPANSTPAPVPNRDLEAPRIVTRDEGPSVAPTFISPRINDRFGAAAGGEAYRRDRMQGAAGAKLTVPFDYDR